MRRLAVVVAILCAATSAWARPPARAAADDSALVCWRYVEGQRAEIKLGDRGSQVIWRVEAEALNARSAWHDVGPPPPPLRGRSDLVSTDDVAWVALAYLKQVERGRGNLGHARDEAKKALRTLLVLQRADGGFVAYQTAAAPGETPAVYNASDWMATARAIQAMGAGTRVLASDGGLSKALQSGLALSLERIRASWARGDRNVGRHLVIDQMRLPAWLPYHRADAAAAVVLGLSDWYVSTRDDRPLPELRALADALVEMQRGSASQYPWSAFLPQPDKPALWYADGNLQACALVRAREALQKPTYLSTAQLEADVLHPRLLAPYPSIWQLTPVPQITPRVPGTAASLAVNAAAVYRATGKDRYAHMAALFATWLLDAGPADEGALYDPATGRCADRRGDGAVPVTASPGASARALWALLEISDTPAARELRATCVDHDAPPLVLPATDGRPVSTPIGTQGVTPPGGPRTLARLANEDAFWLRFEIARPSRYMVDVVYLRDRTESAVLQVRLDGDAILSLPLGATADEPQLTRVFAAGPEALDPGLHTLGVRGNGLALSGGTLVDCLIVAPAAPWRAWQLPDGHRLVIVTNMASAAESCTLPASLALPSAAPHATALRGADDGPAREERVEATRRQDGAWNVRVPTRGSALLEW